MSFKSGFSPEVEAAIAAQQPYSEKLLHHDPGDETTAERTVGDAVLDAMVGRSPQPGDAARLRPPSILKDSGVRETWATGSQRDGRTGKGRYDLIPPGPLFRLARIYEDGAIKYEDDNWRRGQNLRRYCESAIRHLQNYLAGNHDEDHAAQAAWNCFSLMWTESAITSGILPAELDDIPPEPPAYGDKFHP